jgi:hypothetical protein
MGGRSRSLIVEPSTPPNTDIGSIYVGGLTLGTLSNIQQSAFTAQLATILGIDPSIITLRFIPGSLIIIIAINESQIITPSDNAFILNASAILSQLTNIDISNIITRSNTSAVITGIPVIDLSRTVVNISLTLQAAASSRYSIQSINNPVVAYYRNNFMYTVLNSKIVRIKFNGTIDNICAFPEDTIKHIFITNDGNHLVIPSNLPTFDMFSPVKTVYVINVLTGTVYINTLSVEFQYPIGFNQYNNTFFYVSEERTFYQRYMAQIIFSTGDVTAVVTNINIRGKLIFTDINTGYFVGASQNISRLNLLTNQISIISGQVTDTPLTSGTWNNITGPHRSWKGTNIIGGPFRDDEGSNSFFTLIEDICFDSINNRILITDKYAHRIRSLELTSGSYIVTTIAGTSPTFPQHAINSYESSYSDSLLEGLLQIGKWNNGINAMPAFNKVNSTYALSTFNEPRSIALFNNTILVLDDTGTRLLSNGHVSDFTVIDQ